MKSELILAADNLLYWTSHRTYPVRYKVKVDETDASLKPMRGVPMVWLKLDGNLTATDDSGKLRKALDRYDAKSGFDDVQFELQRDSSSIKDAGDAERLFSRANQKADLLNSGSRS